MNIKNLLLTGIVALTTTFSAHADFALLNSNTNRYLSMENGAKSCTCNRTSVGTWERFEFILSGVSGDDGALIFIKSTRNGKYLRRSGNENKVTCTTVTADTSDERMLWSLVSENGDYTDVKWRNESNNKYLREQGTGASDSVRANMSDIDNTACSWDLEDV